MAYVPTYSTPPPPLVPVPDCAWEEGILSVVSPTVEFLQLFAVEHAAPSRSVPGWLQVFAFHLHFLIQDLGTYGDSGIFSSLL